ncbi:metalloregulator ArsR/SmtB family transcription factor, partial [Kaarinaea lacus]
MDYSNLNEVWKALADPARRRILDLLRSKPCTTGELCEVFTDVTRFAVMKHLRVLTDSGLVLIRRDGRERWNYLNAVPLQQIYQRWIKPYEAVWAYGLVRLANHVEKQQKEIAMSMPPSSDVKKIRIEQEIKIKASPALVFKALTEDTQKWWGLPYMQNLDAKQLILEPKLGGRLYEVWSETDGAQWATVTAIKENELLELTGRLAMHGAVQCVVYFNLEPEKDYTLLKFSHHAIGDISEETYQGFSGGWDDLLATRLKA